MGKEAQAVLRAPASVLELFLLQGAALPHIKFPLKSC